MRMPDYLSCTNNLEEHPSERRLNKSQGGSMKYTETPRKDGEGLLVGHTHNISVLSKVPALVCFVVRNHVPSLFIHTSYFAGKSVIKMC